MTRKTILTAALLAVTCVLGVTACGPHTSSNSPQSTGQAQTQQAFKQQSAAEPYPVSLLSDSTERANLIRRLIRFNDPNKIGYVYIINFGKVIGYYVIKGKVSDTDSQLTTSTLVEHHSDSGGGNLTYPAPGDDGSYGPEEEGVFFFTTENVMVETSLQYLYADQPLPINVPLLGGDANATESPTQLSQAQQNECKAAGRAAGISTAAGTECTPSEIAKIAPQGK